MEVPDVNQILTAPNMWVLQTQDETLKSLSLATSYIPEIANLKLITKTIKCKYE